MGVELERMNAEHTMESRQDCQELVRMKSLSVISILFHRSVRLLQFYMVRELTDKLHLVKKRMLNMHQRVKHLKVQ